MTAEERLEGLERRAGRASGCLRRHGVTLIELLVVVVITAVLVIFMMSRDNGHAGLGRRVQCMANLRTLGTGFSFYYEDYNMFPPFGNTQPPDRLELGRTGDSSVIWYDQFRPYDMPHVSALDRESRTERGIHCPDWELPSDQDYAACYGYNQTFYQARLHKKPPSETAFLNDPPATVAIVGDSRGSSILNAEGYADLVGHESQKPDYRHVDDAAVFMFADTHTEVRARHEVPYMWKDSFWSPYGKDAP